MAYRTYRSNTRPRSRRRSRRSAPVRTTHWYRQPALQFTEITAGPQALDLLPDTVLDPGARLGATVTRIHIELRARWVVAQVTPPIWFFYLGVYVGPSTFPTLPLGPGAHANDVDWMFWRAIGPQSAGNLVIGATDMSAQYTFDVKSQRRFYEPTDKLWMIGQAEGNQGVTDSLEPAVTVSTLIKR